MHSNSLDSLNGARAADKKAHLHTLLAQAVGTRQAWKTLRALRMPYRTPPFAIGVGFGHDPRTSATTFAQHFARVHWTPPAPRLGPSPPSLPGIPPMPERGPFTREELDEAIASLKRNKAPGPDDLPAELYSLLTPEARLQLLALYNGLWGCDTLPDALNASIIAAILKPGKSPHDLNSFRPIALLNVTYKLLAKMLQRRLLEHIDPHLVPFQYGFRPGRSTATPVFIARRVQDLAERAGHRLMMLALDYSKAFDFLPHPSIAMALSRHRVDPSVTRLILAIYANPRFTVRLGAHCSEDLRQENGIRQGCPLSPLLFVMVTSMMWQDLLQDLRQRPFINPPGLASPILLYADDTLLLATRPPDLRRLLALTEARGAAYNLQLNKDKCELLVTNDDGVRMYFSNGQAVPKVTHLKYLGAVFHAHLDVGGILRQKFADARMEMRKLERFWAHNQIPLPWKITVFNAVIRTRVFYTLETLELTPTHLTSLDAVYFRSLRRLMRIPPTFVARGWTNARVFARARTLTRGPRRSTGTTLCTFSTYYHSQRLRLLGHLLRAPDNDLARRSLLTHDNRDLTEVVGKRVGRPRNTWLRSAIQDATRELCNPPFFPPDQITVQQLQELAVGRLRPFASVAAQDNQP